MGTLYKVIALILTSHSSRDRSPDNIITPALQPEYNLPDQRIQDSHYLNITWILLTCWKPLINHHASEDPTLQGKAIFLLLFNSYIEEGAF